MKIPPEAVETLRWRGGCLELIDQRILPERFESHRRPLFFQKLF